MDIWSFVLILNFGLIITAAVVWCGIFVYRFIRAYRNGDGDQRGAVDMSNDPTKATDRWNIGRSNLLYNLVYLLVALTVSYLFNLTFLAAVLWCLPLIPAWFLVKKYLRRKGERG